MDLLYRYTQEKKDRTKTKSVSKMAICVYEDDKFLIFNSLYEFDYNREKKFRRVTFEHQFELDTNNGDILVKYQIINDGLTTDKDWKSKKTEKKNDFKKFFNLIENGYERGEKRNKYWGVKFERAKETINKIFINKLIPNFNTNFYKSKNYESKDVFYTLFDLIVDFHLDKKGIKGHDNVYYDIQNEYPKKKWLIKNEYKFLPSILDSYGLKSKFLIKELSQNRDSLINISALNYLCKLFGENYMDYLKKFNWRIHCYDIPPNKRLHELKNESEKFFLVSTINNWEKDLVKSDSLIYSLNKLFSIRELLEQKGLFLKYKAKNDNQFENLMEIWNGHKVHFNRGYKLRYSIPENVIEDLESEIEIDNLRFKPKILLTEDDFRIEAYLMKNCMAKQFIHGSLYFFISLSCNRKRVNLQYRKGNLIQSYGKANTAVSEIFKNAVEVLTKKIEKYSNLTWSKERYDIINY